MTATFSAKPQLQLSLTPRGYTAVLEGRTTRLSDGAGKVLTVLGSHVLSLADVLQRVSAAHPELGSALTKTGLLELLRLDLIDQNLVLDGARTVPAVRPAHRLAPPSVSPVAHSVVARPSPAPTQAASKGLVLPQRKQTEPVAAANGESARREFRRMLAST